MRSSTVLVYCFKPLFGHVWCECFYIRCAWALNHLFASEWLRPVSPGDPELVLLRWQWIRRQTFREKNSLSSSFSLKEISRLPELISLLLCMTNWNWGNYKHGTKKVLQFDFFFWYSLSSSDHGAVISLFVWSSFYDSISQSEGADFLLPQSHSSSSPSWTNKPAA